MKTYLRPFLKIEVVAALGVIIGIRCFSLSSATASESGEEYGPRIPLTLSCVMSFS